MVATAATTNKTPDLADIARSGMRGGHEDALDAQDLVRPLASRRGVRAHAADWLSRMERRATYLPV